MSDPEASDLQLAAVPEVALSIFRLGADFEPLQEVH
jgi:hypothetical protein